MTPEQLKAMPADELQRLIDEALPGVPRIDYARSAVVLDGSKMSAAYWMAAMPEQPPEQIEAWCQEFQRRFRELDPSQREHMLGVLNGEFCECGNPRPCSCNRDE